MNRPVCVVIGVGPGNGSAIARKFRDQNYSVALLSRNRENILELANSQENTFAYQYDVKEPKACKKVFNRIRKDLGPINTLVYNAGGGAWKNIEETTLEEMESSWRTNVAGLFSVTQEVTGDMFAAGRGNIVIIGATASVRGGPQTAPFASAKAGQRSLAQSMAKHLGPKGVHVSYVVVDGLIDRTSARNMKPDEDDDFFMNPDDIAESVFFLTSQSKSAWTFELDLRPFGERWS